MKKGTAPEIPAAPTPVHFPARKSLPAVPPAPAKADDNPRMAAAMPGGVHLASYRNAANARQGWEQLSRRNGDLLRGLHADIRRVDANEKGVFFRLYAAPVVSTVAATELCRKLRQRGVYCAPRDS